MGARPSAPPPSSATPMRGRVFRAGCASGAFCAGGWDAGGFCCARQIEHRSSEERNSATEKFRMNVLHRGLGGGESESAPSVAQLARSGKRFILNQMRVQMNEAVAAPQSPWRPRTQAPENPSIRKPKHQKTQASENPSIRKPKTHPPTTRVGHPVSFLFVVN